MRFLSGLALFTLLAACGGVGLDETEAPSAPTSRGGDRTPSIASPAPLIPSPGTETPTAAPPAKPVSPSPERPTTDVETDPGNGWSCPAGPPGGLSLDPIIEIEGAASVVAADEFVLEIGFAAQDLRAELTRVNPSFWAVVVGFEAPALPLPQPDPGWFLNGAGNFAVNVSWNSAARDFEVFASAFRDDGWSLVTTNVDVDAGASSLVVRIPAADVQPADRWFAAASDGATCHSVGLGPDRRAQLRF